MGLVFQEIVLSSALLLSILATGVLTSPLSAGTVASISKRDGDEALTTYTAWPTATIVPVTTYVTVPQVNLLPCTAWFFFICETWGLSSNDIGGWQLTLPPGVYPPVPPEFQLPPGFSISGDLQAWPSLTIGNDNIPTFAPRPTSCEVTNVATMFITTTTYGVSISSTATSTTSTGVVTATSVIRGCGTESSSTATTLPTSSSSSVSSLSSESISSSISSIESTSSSISSIESTQIPTSIQDTIESPATNTDSGPLPTQTWHLTMYDTACGEDTNNYYSLRGYALPNDPKTCTSLKDGKVPMASDRKDSCEFFVNGGNSPGKACSEGTFSEPTSFVIRDGYCIVWEDENCQGIGIKFYTPLYHGCVNVKDAINPPKNWQAVKCYAQ